MSCIFCGQTDKELNGMLIFASLNPGLGVCNLCIKEIAELIQTELMDRRLDAERDDQYAFIHWNGDLE